MLALKPGRLDFEELIWVEKRAIVVRLLFNERTKCPIIYCETLRNCRTIIIIGIGTKCCFVKRTHH
jgi:hypothetical protein